MEEQHLDDNNGLDAAMRRELRLSALLRDLVDERGRLEAAAVLGVNYKTLARAVKPGRLTSHMSDALARLELSREERTEAAEPERATELEQRVAQLEAGIESLTGELRDGLAELRVGLNELREAVRDGARSAGAARPLVAAPAGERTVADGRPALPGLPPRRPPALRRAFPDVVTVAPADDDAAVYGDAWPLVEEWRRLRAGHPTEGRGVRWLETEERILVLALAMLEEHGLTLPPETQPLRGFARKGQTRWRKTALYDTQRALVWAKLRRWVRRILTLGLSWN